MLSLSFLNGLGYRFGNPEGIVPFSPGLRGTSYPGLLPSGFSTPTGLRQISAAEPQPRWRSLSLVHISSPPLSIGWREGRGARSRDACSRGWPISLAPSDGERVGVRGRLFPQRSCCPDAPKYAASADARIPRHTRIPRLCSVGHWWRCGQTSQPPGIRTSDN